MGVGEQVKTIEYRFYEAINENKERDEPSVSEASREDRRLRLVGCCCGFECVKTSQQKMLLQMNSNETIQNLFKMTPYYYKTGIEDQQKINNLDYLETQAEFEIRVYEKD